MAATDPKRVAYIEPKHFSNGLCPFFHPRGWPGFLDGLESNESYDYLLNEYYATCASENGICSDRECLIEKGQIRFTHTRYDLNYNDSTWYKPQSFCLRCAPPFSLTFCGSINTDHLPKDAHSLLDTVVKIASKEKPFFVGYGEEGELSVEEVANYLNEEDLREYKKVKRAYDQEKAEARANPRRLPDEVLNYRCKDDSLLKPEPNGTSVYDKDTNPFEKPDIDILMNWHRVEY